LLVPPYKIEEATIADLHWVHSLAHQIWPHTFAAILSTGQIAYMLELIYSSQALEKQQQDGQRFFLLYEADEPIGYFAVQHHLKDGTYTKLHKIYLLSQRQGSGLGKSMFNYALQIAKDTGDKYFYLNVNKYNNAIEFYKRAGMTIVLEEDIDIGGGYFMNDYVLQLTMEN
jgi:diamine N-acetyltransferase